MLCLTQGGLELKKRHLTDTSLLVLLLGREGRNYKIFYSYFKTRFLAVKGQQQQDGCPPAEHNSVSLLSNFILLVSSAGRVTVWLTGPTLYPTNGT
jgi:hypothetical protein